MAVRGRGMLDAKELRRLEQIYLAEAERSTRDLERDNLLMIARDCGYTADRIERRAVIHRTMIVCVLAALALFAVLVHFLGDGPET